MRWPNLRPQTLLRFWRIPARFLPLLLPLLLTGSILPMQHSESEYRAHCAGHAPAFAIPACTVLLASASETDADRSADLKHRAAAYTLKRQFDNAIRDLGQAIELNPDDADALYGLGVTLYRKGDFQNAISEFTMAIWNAPNDAKLYAARANAYYGAKDFESAITDYSQAIRMAPENTEYLYARALAHTSNDEYDRAIQDLDRIIALDPSSDAVFHARGIAYYLQHDLKHAIEDFGRAIVLDPLFADAYTDRGIAYADDGDQDRAISDFDRAITLDPDDARAFTARGNSYRLSGDYDRAIKDFSRAIALRPTVTRLEARGIMLMTVGRYARATTDFRTAMRMAPMDAYAAAWWHLALGKMADVWWLPSPADDIDRATAKLDSERWPSPVISLFHGEMEPEDVRDAAADTVQRCQAEFFTGEYQLLHAEPADGRQLLLQSMESCPGDSFERAVAAEELKSKRGLRLAGSPILHASN
jgi:tetratricopeptide (TPR) repeat protein